MKDKRFFFKMIALSLARRRGRMAAALLAVSLGAGVLSGLVSLCRDIPRQMGREFRSYGANLVLMPAGNRASFTRAELALAASLFPPDAVVGVTPWRYGQVKVNEQPFMAAGTDFSAARDTCPYWLVRGTLPAKPGEALLGDEAAALLRLAPGSSFTINGNAFTVSGTLSTGSAEEGFIMVSLADFARIDSASASDAKNDDHLDAAECSIALTSAELDILAAKVNAAVSGVEARPVKRLAVSEGAVLKKLSALVLLVTVVVLMLILICVATTMMAMAAERRGEIGLRKALGAGDGEIAAEFFGEGALLGAAGGILGGFAGFLFASQAALRVFHRPLAWDPLSLPLTVLACIALTTAASAFPVGGASKVDPALVLRGE